MNESGAFGIVCKHQCERLLEMVRKIVNVYSKQKWTQLQTPEETGRKFEFSLFMLTYWLYDQQDILGNRSQCVNINNENSNFLPVSSHSGVQLTREYIQLQSYRSTFVCYACMDACYRYSYSYIVKLYNYSQPVSYMHAFQYPVANGSYIQLKLLIA